MARIGQQLVAGYREAGHQVEVLQRREVGEAALGEVRLSGLALAWPRVSERLDGCDLVHLHGPAPAFADVFLLGCVLRRARRRRTPALLYSHNFEVHFPGLLSPLGRLYERATLALAARAASRIVVSTEQFRRRLPRPGLAAVVPWGCDHRPLVERDAAAADATRGAEEARKPELRLLFVGQMRPYKGLPVLLEALRGVSGVAARVAGGGRRLSVYQRSVALGGPDLRSVELLGPVDDARLDQLYAWADVVVLPSLSRQEAFGLVLLEGMRAGCVPVASRLPGVEEVIGDAGLLVPPADAGALRAAIETLRDDRALLEELAARARRRAAERTWARSVERHLALAHEIAGDPALRRDARVDESGASR